MSDTKADMVSELGKVAIEITTGNYAGAVAPTRRLLAMLVAYELPPIDAPDLDPGDRAAVDADVDEAIKKP
jgi:hypothetical protein